MLGCTEQDRTPHLVSVTLTQRDGVLFRSNHQHHGSKLFSDHSLSQLRGSLGLEIEGVGSMYTNIICFCNIREFCMQAVSHTAPAAAWSTLFRVQLQHVQLGHCIILGVGP